MLQRCYFAASRYDHKMRRDGLILWAKLIFRLSNGTIFQTEFESEHLYKVYGQQLHGVADLIFSNLKKKKKECGWEQAKKLVCPFIWRWQR